SRENVGSTPACRKRSYVDINSAKLLYSNAQWCIPLWQILSASSERPGTAKNAIRWFASSFVVQAAVSFRNCTCVPTTSAYHLIISSRWLVFIVTWCSDGLTSFFADMLVLSPME